MMIIEQWNLLLAVFYGWKGKLSVILNILKS